MIVRLKDEIQPEDGGAIVDVGDCWNVFRSVLNVRPYDDFDRILSGVVDR